MNMQENMENEIIVGRDGGTQKLYMSVGGKKALLDTVPLSVSREHCAIVAHAEGDYLIKNLKAENVTYVNGSDIISKRITPSDKIELGKDRYVLAWDSILKMLPPLADIRPLQQVWEDMESQRLATITAERRFNALRGITGVLTMSAIVLTSMGLGGPIYLCVYITAILLSLFFTAKAYVNASNAPKKNKRVELDFQGKYVCPHCKRFLGNSPYHLLSQNSHCPYCKSKFVK